MRSRLTYTVFGRKVGDYAAVYVTGGRIEEDGEWQTIEQPDIRTLLHDLMNLNHAACGYS